jgi:hypothetical protein
MKNFIEYVEEQKMRFQIKNKKMNNEIRIAFSDSPKSESPLQLPQRRREQNYK